MKSVYSIILFVFALSIFSAECLRAQPSSLPNYSKDDYIKMLEEQRGVSLKLRADDVLEVIEGWCNWTTKESTQRGFPIILFAGLMNCHGGANILLLPGCFDKKMKYSLDMEIMYTQLLRYRYHSTAAPRDSSVLLMTDLLYPENFDVKDYVKTFENHGRTIKYYSVLPGVMHFTDGEERESSNIQEVYEKFPYATRVFVEVAGFPEFDFLVLSASGFCDKKSLEKILKRFKFSRV